MEPIKTEVWKLQYQKEKYWHSKRVRHSLWNWWISKTQGAPEIESGEIGWDSQANYWRDEFYKLSKTQGPVVGSNTLTTNVYCLCTYMRFYDVS